VALIFADHLIIVCEGIYNFFDIAIKIFMQQKYYLSV